MCPIVLNFVVADRDIIVLCATFQNAGADKTDSME